MTNDFSLQQISLLLDEKLDQKLAPIFKVLEYHGEMLESHGKMLESHTKILDSHTKLLESHSKLLESHSKTLKSHGTMLRSIKDDQNMIIGTFDQTDIYHGKRLDRLEEHCCLAPL